MASTERQAVTMHQTAMGRADLHMHTTASDGLVDVQPLLDYIARRGHLEVIAITDHDTLEASLWAYERRAQYPFEIIPGIEVTTAEGHVLALWVTCPIPAGLSLAETAAAVHDQGGIAILAHPFHVHVLDVLSGIRRYGRNPAYIAAAGLDGVEVHNAGILVAGCNLVAKRFARTLSLAFTGSSDAHTPGATGSGLTRFPGRTADDLRLALDNRQTLPSGGVWPLRDYLAVARALPNWRSPHNARARVALADPDKELA